MKVMQLVVEEQGFLTENQHRTVRIVQKVKEQAMINIVINKAGGNKLKTTWIDVKKTFMFVENTSYLIECIEKQNFPSWIYPFLKSTIERCGMLKSTWTTRQSSRKK